ncbi:histidine--tRNA ligase [uncultured Traorella sp.]|uniref:histidine--tRNA ligase n=1 Tax=uncultured Traorella sp. TaxID=1929048 RepID=UPI0025ECCC92|nr:histidine--tRNA ligase [uncultured Traorella sp.]
MTNYQMPRGTQDILPNEIEKWHALEEYLQKFTTLYHYKEIRTPIFEHTEVFKRGNDSSDMVNKEMYTFMDNGARSLTLRPEGTAGVCRSFVENKLYGSPDLPVKLYYMGPMMRYERPQKGRQRIFNQFGVEVLGVKNPYLDVETIALGYSILSGLGLKDLVVQLNTLGDDESRNNYREALKKHFHGYLDELCVDCHRRYEQNPLRILDCKVDHDHPAMKSAPKISDYLNEESRDYFEKVKAGLDALEIPYTVEDRLVRGLDYYTHTVFEIVSVNEDMGAQATLLAGGRYDGLIEYFGGPEMSGIGWALGMERILLALEAENIEIAKDEGIDAYVLCLCKEAQLEAFKLTTMLRSHGFICDTDYQQRSFKAQFKSVERMKAKIAILVGEDELASHTLSLKKIDTQEQFKIPADEIITKMDELLEERF